MCEVSNVEGGTRSTSSECRTAGEDQTRRTEPKIPGQEEATQKMTEIKKEEIISSSACSSELQQMTVDELMSKMKSTLKDW